MGRQPAAAANPLLTHVHPSGLVRLPGGSLCVPLALLDLGHTSAAARTPVSCLGLSRPDGFRSSLRSDCPRSIVPPVPCSSAKPSDLTGYCKPPEVTIRSIPVTGNIVN